ncbi:hypothetical protein [Bradyrhizobium diversitatis]|uniref:Uncharacterized protein n=1 Tax=Bradyrhizobium diversitatis TaxID=2755406 RepID=A0ABS0PAN9_9BRAD|nr:hypothetical protein [Bradyrhizobium diversitatis]MBH5390372.1 hypothetical protein [Bradyrhizobium diversitatis]
MRGSSSTSTDADKPHPEEARKRRLEGRGVRAGCHQSHVLARAVEIAIQLEDANELALSADAVAPSLALYIRITPADAIEMASPILLR